jgi:hypothetical protein
VPARAGVVVCVGRGSAPQVIEPATPPAHSANSRTGRPAAFAGNVTGSGYNSHRAEAAAPSGVPNLAMSDLAESATPGGPMPPTPPISPGHPRPANLRSAGGAVLPLVPRPARRPARPRPLPDAAAVRLSSVPDSAPPYDDAAGPGPGGERRGARPARPGRVTGPASASGPAESRPGPARTRPGPDGPGTRPDAPGPDGPRPQQGPHGPGTPAQRRDPAAWPSQFAQVLAETLAGSRPRGQIRPWATDQALRRIRQLGPMLAAPAGGVQPRVRRVVTSRPAAGVVEMTVIVGVGPSIRALAVRLEQDGPHRAGRGHGPRSAGWICTAIEAA